MDDITPKNITADPAPQPAPQPQDNLPKPPDGSSPGDGVTTPPQATPTPTPPADLSEGLLGGDDPQPQPQPGEGEPKDKPTTLGAPQEGYKTDAWTGATPDMIEAFSGVAKELDLSQEATDKLSKAMGPAMQRHYQNAIAQASKEWAKRSMSDPEFGGQNWAKNQASMTKVYQKYASPELRKVFRQAGLDTHPEVLRMMYRISQDVSEDVLLKGSGQGSLSGDDFRSMYPNTKMNP